MQLTKNFTLEELTRSSIALMRGISNQPDSIQIGNLKKLCESLLQPIRDRLGLPIIITSGFRSPVLNKAVGGVANSRHLYGEAADIICRDNRRLWNLIREMISNGEINVGELINEKNLTWIHLSLP